MMTNNQQNQDSDDELSDKERQERLNATLQAAKSDSSVKAALKKEMQPVSIDDFSPLQNTSATGTTGGDQRATEEELKQVGQPVNNKSQKQTGS